MKDYTWYEVQVRCHGGREYRTDNTKNEERVSVMLGPLREETENINKYADATQPR